MNRAPRLTVIALLAAAGAVAAPAIQEATAAESRLEAATSRCSKFSELVSCDAALSMKPNDPALLVAEGDALVRLKRPGEAIGVYRNAMRSGAGQDAVNPKIALAQTQRRSLLEVCEAEAGAAAERACESAWLPGAPDEVTLFKRRGLLLQQENQPVASLDAYMAAARLAPRDREVARAVVALSGAVEHPDAPTLTARGAALMTLRRTGDAIVSLREALRLEPDFTDAKVRLRLAESILASQRRSSAVAAASITAPEAAHADGAVSNAAPATRSN